MSKIHIALKGENSTSYCFEVVYPDNRVFRYYVPAGQDANLPIDGGCFVRFSLIPLDDLKDEPSK